MEHRNQNEEPPLPRPLPQRFPRLANPALRHLSPDAPEREVRKLPKSSSFSHSFWKSRKKLLQLFIPIHGADNRRGWNRIFWLGNHPPFLAFYFLMTDALQYYHV